MKKPLYGAGKIITFNIVLKIALDLVNQLIVYMQIFEWHSIATLLSWQKTRTDREIYEDNRTEFKNFKLSYHNTEKRIQNVYKKILPLYTLVFLAGIVGVYVIDRAEWFLFMFFLKVG